MSSIKTQARLTGLIYFLASVPAPLGLVYVPNKLIALNDATATANNIRASAQQSDLFAFTKLRPCH